MSPFGFGYGSAIVWGVGSGYFDGDRVSVGVAGRPSISIASDITISGGTGTSEDPYVVE